TISDLRPALGPQRRAGRSIGLVPTMSYLHGGHMALVDRAKAVCDLVVVSIFVNPTQFGPNEDLASYPRDLEADLALCRTHGVDVVFAPDVAEMYPEPMQTTIDVSSLSSILIGIDRPGHFQGVCQIVDKLLNATQPRHLLLGQKDYQQCMVIQKMIALRNHKVTLHICPTLREAEGLAMSSRNMRLSSAEREAALAIFEVLNYLKQHLRTGSLDGLEHYATETLTGKGFAVDYVAIANAGDLSPAIAWDGSEKLVALVAATINEVRLIDNLFLN
ncbi:MAG: pantoate--beta-alanine ligase, partial [Hyphomicrobiales bacterium]